MKQLTILLTWKYRMSSNWPLLVSILRKDRSLSELKEPEWDLLIRQARCCQLVGKLYYVAEAEQLLHLLPAAVFRHLESARAHVAKQHRDFLWEVERLKMAFKDTGVSLLMLKGAAYAIAQLPPYLGRTFSDIDLLVPFDAIAKIEKQLMLHGWINEETSNYDQRYYRQWMHEIPPLRHFNTGSVVDLHHNILPRTASACPDASLLIDAAVAAPGTVDESADIKLLSPLDRIIHSATHLFYDGELGHGLRDLVDLDGLVRELDVDSKLLLLKRATQLGLETPVYYALHYLQLILNTPGLDDAISKIEPSNGLPKRMVFMDALFLKALMPDHPSCNNKWSTLARFILFVRAHYLRMPLYLLIPHLLRKARMRLIDTLNHTQ
jgi:hypothetical protein